MDNRWMPLGVDRSSITIPTLLLKCAFDRTGYSIFVTDLARVWTEALNREQVIQRASQDKTSIDPSDDDSQLAILLDKIKNAVEGREKSSLQLQVETDESLVLIAAVTLPPPLSPLRWSIHLTLASQDVFREQVVVGCIETAYLHKRFVQELLQQINDKDHVISKLLDRIESSGTAIESIFPGTAGIKHSAKGISREQAGRLVRGLAGFDQQRSLEKVTTSGTQDVSLDEMSREVFDHNELASMRSRHQKDDDVIVSAWWKALPKAGHQGSIPLTTLSPPTGRSMAKKLPRNDSEAEDASGFQRQITPPRARKKANPEPVTSGHRSHAKVAVQNTVANLDDDSTDDGLSRGEGDGPTTSGTKEQYQNLDDETDSEPTTPATKERDIQTPSSSGTKKMGVIGGRKVQLDPMKGEDANRSVSRESPSPAPAARSAHMLGKIGGRKIVSASISELPTSGSDASNELGSSKVKNQSPESTAGKSAITVSSAGMIDTRPKTQIDTKTEVQSSAQDAPPESSQDKAKRLREKLKHDLEVKSKAAPKKKRRF